MTEDPRRVRPPTRTPEDIRTADSRVQKMVERVGVRFSVADDVDDLGDAVTADQRPSARFISTYGITEAKRLGVEALAQQAQRGPVMLTRRGKAVAVMISWDLYRLIYPNAPDHAEGGSDA